MAPNPPTSTSRFQRCVVETLRHANSELLEILSLRGVREDPFLAKIARGLGDLGFVGAETNKRIPGMGRQQFDLYCPGVPDIIAELKVVGGNFYTKNIDGRHLSRERAERYCRESLRAADIRYHPVEGSICKDWGGRLLVAPITYEKYMILVIPDRGLDGPIGSVLTTMNFADGELFEEQLSGFRVRMWKVRETPILEAA